jgi:hypothetical protein
VSITRKFYDCGCISAMLVDDELTTPKEIAEFAGRMAKTKRRMEPREVSSDDDRIALFARCSHKEALLP